MISQDKYERLIDLMARKGVPSEGFEILADLRVSEKMYAEQRDNAYKELALNYNSQEDDEEERREYKMMKDMNDRWEYLMEKYGEG